MNATVRSATRLAGARAASHLIDKRLKCRQLHACLIKILAILDVFVQHRFDIEGGSIPVLLHAADATTSSARYTGKLCCAPVRKQVTARAGAKRTLNC